MNNSFWTRRRFVSVATAASASSSLVSSWPHAFAQQAPPRSQATSPEITSGRIVPLLESNVARPMRYKVEDGAFVIHNGSEFFNRPLYGPNIPFRVDGGDLPEFSLYLPGHGGNLRFGISGPNNKSLWLFQAASVTTRYTAGRLLYEIRDPQLGASGVLHIEALTIGAGLWLEIIPDHVAPGVSLTWAFAGVSGRKGKRNGDIGCEVEPVSRFFQLRPEESRDNQWKISGSEAEVLARKIRLRLQPPANSEMYIADAALWNADASALWTSAASTTPALVGRVPLDNSALRLRIDVLEGALQPATTSQDFAARRAGLARISNSITWITPDPWLNGIASALGTASDAIWDETQGCVMHGAVAWRTPLAGWRGPYALNATGRHDRMKRHLRRWMARQNIDAITNGASGTPTPQGFTGISEATGKPDHGSAGSRTENLLHSNGDLSHNHYDMNLVFFDALLRHLRWTGDIAFAREAWPALQRHAAWERRLFRRDFGAGENQQPLYEAYAAIWASDNLQYNGGGAAHSSAYNIFLNRSMATVAELIGEDPTIAAAHRAEADLIANAMRNLLWMPEQGAFAESKDWLGDRTLNESPAMWTMYHTIDSEVATPKEAWQIAAERLRAIRKVPIKGTDVPEGGWQIACSDWLPYEWSLTLLALGENLHTALALFQAGLAVDAYDLLRGCFLDAGYRGLCPGNFPMSLQLDPHRQESQRDFADPIGCASRAIVEGLWGILPNLTSQKLVLRPQLPEAWRKAEFHHPDLDLAYAREALSESWTVATRLARPVNLTLRLQARTTEIPAVRVNGHTVPARFDTDAIGSPQLIIGPLHPVATWHIEVRWHGNSPIPIPTHATVCKLGDKPTWPAGISPNQIDDPQNCLRMGQAKVPGGHTVFARIGHAACRYWLPIEIKILDASQPNRQQHPDTAGHFEPLDLEAHLDSHVREIFTRGYNTPHSKFCSLALPDTLLGGWANFDKKATIDDAGLRAANGRLRIIGGLTFLTPSNSATPNCRFLSQWSADKTALTLNLAGKAKAVYFLLACTTFPQATRSRHGSIRVHYADGGPTGIVLRSPQNWWPIEQDYPIDDYIFRLEPIGEPQLSLPIRVDLKTGTVRILDRNNITGHARAIDGGSATILRVAVDEHRDLSHLELKCELFGVVMGVLAITVSR